MVTRINGMASGMDIDTMVKGMMDAQRIPLDKLYQKKTYTEWQRDDYRTMNTALSELDTQIFNGIGMQKSFIAKTVTVSDPNAVAVKNINSTADFSGTVKVNILATASTIYSNAATKIASKSAKLSTYPGITVPQDITIAAMNKNGQMETKTVSITSDDTMDSLVQKINSQTNVNAFFDETSQKVSFAAKYTGIDSSNKGINLTGAFFSEIFSPSTTQPEPVTAGGLTFDFANAGATLNGYTIEFGTVADGTAVSASIDETNKKIMINGDFTSTGFSTTADIQSAITAEFTAKGGSFTGITATVTGTSGAVTAGTSSVAINNNFQSRVGVNADIEYNGMPITRTSNTFTINGAEITLKQPTGTNAPPVTFSSTPDVDTVYSTIKSFVDSYNGLIANISDKLSEKKDTNYPPLTDAQKKDMKDTDITLWEAKAKKGTLRNDSTLSSLLTKMRSSISTSVSNTTFGDMSKIGISTTSNYLDGGKLQIDETKLKAAISADPDGVYKLFTSDDGSTTDDKGKGVSIRLRANLKSAMADISTKAGKTSSVNKTFTLGKLLDDYTTKITSMNDRLTTLETRYYKQFTAMEQAVQNANNQSASLSSFLGNGN